MAKKISLSSRRRIFQLAAIAVAAMIFLAANVVSKNDAQGFVRGENFTEPVLPFSADDVFDRQAALARLREQIKGREKEPAGDVFKNVRILKEMPAGRLLAVMEMGYSRALGVDCTHCHTPEKWEAEEKSAKQIAREMWLMANDINSRLLTGVKNLKSPNPTVNCTTCHRGEIKPALNLPPAKP